MVKLLLGIGICNVHLQLCFTLTVVNVKDNLQRHYM